MRGALLGEVGVTQAAALGLASALMLAACGGPQAASPTAGAASVSPAPAVETVALGLSYPWGMAFLPDGRILVTERDGRLRMIADGALAPAPISGAPEVYAAGQGGLLDVAIHPDFAANGLVYLSYSAGTEDANGLRLARGRLEGGALTNVEVIFRATPDKRGEAHFGGRILFLPDRTLLLSLGDGYRYRNEAQNLGSHLGKIVRLTADGGVPTDNPLTDRSGARPEIFSLGHRNVQGLALDPATGRIYESEFGPRGGDELNVITPGRNYGWPVITYGVDYSGVAISPFKARDGMEQPLAYWTPSISPSGIAFYTGTLFPAWTGDVFLATLSGQHLRRIDLDAFGRVLGQETLLADVARLRDVEQGPDGALYVLTDAPDGALLRLTPPE